MEISAVGVQEGFIFWNMGDALVRQSLTSHNLELYVLDGVTFKIKSVSTLFITEYLADRNITLKGMYGEPK